MTNDVDIPKRKPFRILPSHERVLQALGRYDRLTAEQVRRLLFGTGSITRAQTLLKQLADHGYALRVPVGRSASHGSGPLIYTLDRRGRAYLHALGQGDPRRLRQSEERERSSPHLRHSIAVVDVLILHELLCRAHARFSVARMLGERELKSQAVKVTMPDGRRRGVAPDAWVDVRIRYPDNRARQLCIAYEVDGGTEFQEHWRTKVRALLAYERGPYGQVFGAQTPLLIVVVALTEERTAQLRRWTGNELREQRAEDRADLFRFGTTPDDPGDVASFFFSPHWFVPGHGAPVALVTGL